MTSLEVAEILEMIPDELQAKVAEQTNVDWNVSQLRGSVMLDLLLFSSLRSERNSTYVMEELYKTSFFEAFSSKDSGHITRHSSLASRLGSMNPEYFKAIFEWVFSHFAGHCQGTKWHRKINRFDSTLISISSALVSWGMRVGRPPAEGFAKVQFKVTVGLKGVLPHTVQTFFEQEHLSEETALTQAILAANPDADDYVVFDRGLKSRQTFKDFDLQDISFVTRGSENIRYDLLEKNRDVPAEQVDGLRFIQDSKVHLYANSNTKVEHPFRLIEAEVVETGERLFFITNIWDLKASEIATIYRYRWDIEVFFRFIKQELNIKHLLNRSENGVLIQVYVTLILAILLTVFKLTNQIKSYKLAKIRFEDQLLLHLVNERVKLQKWRQNTSS